MQETLINDLLDLAKMDNNKFSINTDYFDLVETLKHSFQILLKVANMRQIKLTSSIEDTQ